MKGPSLHQLEREVEAARAKLATDLATLASPTTFSDFKEQLKAGAADTKEALIQNAKSTLATKFQQAVDDLKAKAIANPGAALAITAGIAWRLVHRPPIATALIGGGLYSLFKTSFPRAPYMDLYDEDEGVRRFRTNGSSGMVSQKMADVTGKVEQWGVEASALAQRAVEELKDRTSAAADKASKVFDDAQQTATEMAAKTAGDASAAVIDSLRDEDLRDKLLFGAAALAVAAAFGISFTRTEELR